jgi:hypothetical protein
MCHESRFSVQKTTRKQKKKIADVHLFPGLDSNPRPLFLLSLIRVNCYHEHIGFIFGVITAVFLKIQAFWDVTLCGLVVTDISAERYASIFRVKVSLHGVLDPDGGGSTILRNVSNYYQSRRHNVTE